MSSTTTPGRPEAVARPSERPLEESFPRSHKVAVEVTHGDTLLRVPFRRVHLSGEQLEPGILERLHARERFVDALHPDE